MNFGNFQIDDNMLRAFLEWQRNNQGQGGGMLPGMGGGVTQDLQNMSMEKDWLGRNIGPSAVGSAQGISPGGEAHNQFMQSEYMKKAPPSVPAMGGMDPKSRMMLMVGQKLFNRAQDEPEMVPMRTSPVNVGGMTPMSGDVMRGMQMQRGNMPDFRLGAGMLSDPNIRRRRPQFLYGI